MYTEGITESRNPAGEEFGEDRLAGAVTALGKNDPIALVEEAIAAARQFSNGHFEDDLTVVAISIE